MRVSVERGALVRVLAVAQVLQLDEPLRRLRRELGALGHAIGGRGDGREVVGDGTVVVGDAVEGGHREREARGLGDRAVRTQFGQHARVLRCASEHGHVFPVLRRRSHHRRPADVDVLDRVGQRASGPSHRSLERIEVDDEQVDRRDAVLRDRGHVLRRVAPREQAAVDGRVQRLDAAVEHFRKAGVLGNLGHREARVREQLRGAAGRQQLHAEPCQLARELDDAGLVGDGNQCMHGGA